MDSNRLTHSAPLDHYSLLSINPPNSYTTSNIHSNIAHITQPLSIINDTNNHQTTTKASFQPLNHAEKHKIHQIVESQNAYILNNHKLPNTSDFGLKERQNGKIKQMQRVDSEKSWARINKIGSKIKNKAQFHNNMAGSGSYGTIKSTSSKNKHYSIDIRQEDNKYENMVEWVNSQVGSINLRISKHQQKISKHQQKMLRLQAMFRKGEQVNQSHYKSQMQEINSIFNLLEQPNQRNDQLKIMAMIEQMRSNILEIHQEIAKLQLHPPTDHTQPPTTSIQQPDTHNIQQVIKRLSQMMEKRIEEQIVKQSKKMEKIIEEEMLKQQERVEKRFIDVRRCNNEIIKSGRRFQGKLRGVFYEQRVCGGGEQLLCGGGDKLVLFSKRYLLDVDGYLLDENCYYLLNSVGQSIRLSQSQIKLLQKHQLL